jgi:hypothetical protein
MPKLFGVLFAINCFTEIIHIYIGLSNQYSLLLLSQLKLLRFWMRTSQENAERM